MLPPLIINAVLRLATGRARAVPGGLRLGLLVTAQLLISEEILLDSALAGILLIVAVRRRQPPPPGGGPGPGRVVGGLGHRRLR